MPANHDDIAHRPWPLPLGKYSMEMVWHDLLFAHWPVSKEALRSLIPSRLEIDEYEGEAWIGVVPFMMSGVRLRQVPGIPGTSQFPEINVRTYVKEGGKPGVFFFSLDAGSIVAVKAARLWYHLPYYHARMSASCVDDAIAYNTVRRVKPGQPEAVFKGSYRPITAATCGGCGPLAHWLTERYCLYSVRRDGVIYRADVHHAMWPLQLAEADIEVNTMTAPLGITLPKVAPLLHYAKHLEVSAWGPQRL